MSEECTEILYLRTAYATLAPFFNAIGRVHLPEPSKKPVVDAVILYVVGQMLSAKAAKNIHKRLLLASELDCRPPWKLDEAKLRGCGLSHRKLRAIREFGLVYENCSEEIESWRNIPFSSLKNEVNKFWGLSDWTAAMLAIFHFGHTDVLPLSDGSIKRVITMLEQRFLEGIGSFDPTKASPYGTQLSMIFWASLDRGYWKQ